MTKNINQKKQQENNISVIITNYNKGSKIIQAINSVRNQIDDEDEIILIDDCSTEPETINLLENLEFFKNFNFYQTPINLGASGAKNFGILNSTNDIIVLLDGDDCIPDKSLKIIKNAFFYNPGIDFLFGNYIEFDTDLKLKKHINCSDITDSNNLLDPYKLALNWKLLGTSPFKKSLFNKVGGFDSFYPRTDDIDFQRRAINMGFKAIYVDKTIYIWNKSNNGNNAMIPKKELIFSLIRNFEFYYNYLPKTKYFILLIKTFFKLFLFRFFKIDKL